MEKREGYNKLNAALKMFKVLANANRLKIVKFLMKQENCSAIAGDIMKALGISESNLSNHLKLMRISKILAAKQDGTHMHYSIKDPVIKEIVACALK